MTLTSTTRIFSPKSNSNASVSRQEAIHINSQKKWPIHLPEVARAARQAAISTRNRATTAAVALAIALSFIIAPVNALGAGGIQQNGVWLGGETTAFNFTPDIRIYIGDSDEKYRDFFGDDAKGMLPGDTVSFTVALSNQTSHPVVFYMRAHAMNQDETETLREDLHDVFSETAAADLLNDVNITITDLVAGAGEILYKGTLAGAMTGGKQIYDGQTGAQNAAGFGGVRLGTMQANTVGYMNVTLSLSAASKAVNANMLAAVNWQFAAEWENSDSTTPTSSGSPPPSRDPTPGDTSSPSDPFDTSEPESTTDTPSYPDSPTATYPSDAPADTPREPVATPHGPVMTPGGSPTPGDTPDITVEITPPKTGESWEIYGFAAICALSIIGMVGVLFILIRNQKKNKTLA
jgi:hypothetical protein